jgi:hypothetical protein
MNKLVLAFIFSSLLATGCGKNHVRLSYIKKVNFVLDGFNENKQNYRTFNISIIEDKPVVHYFDQSDSCFVIKPLFQTKSEQSNRYKLSNVIQNNIVDSYNQWGIINLDTIFAISRSNHSVLQFNVHDSIIDIMPLYAKKPINNLPYVYISFLGHEMEYHKDNLIIPITAKSSFDSIRKAYYKMSGLIINLQQKTIESYGIYSEKDFMSSLKHMSPYNSYCLNGTKILFSYSNTGSIFEYDFETGEYQTHDRKSNYINEINPIPDSMLHNLNYIKEYGQTEPRYLNLTYDSYRNIYYRTVKHRVIKQQNDGIYKKKTHRSTHSIMIFNDNFELIDEFILDTIVAADWLLPTKEGLLFSEVNNENQNSDTLCFHLYKIEL